MGLNDNKILFIFEHLQDIAENDELEFKGAKGGFPGSFWETYSSFANTNGGLIVLGIREKNGQFIPDGLTDEDIDKLTKDLWSGLGNRNTISINLLNNADVQPLRKEDVRILVVRIPRAQRDQKPVHVGLDPYGGTYKRGYEGDFKCTRGEVQRMFADADIEHTNDKRILIGYTVDDIDLDSVHRYRRLFNIAKPDHVWSTLDDMAFLKQLGAYRRERRTGEEGFTVAGILMFGKTNAITDDDCAPNFFPDYRDETTIGGTNRWIDRIYPDGTWEANLFQFYLRTLPRLQSFLPKPFSLEGNQRIDQSPAHIAIREVFVNLCVHADYRAEGSLSVVFQNGTYRFSNPGTMLVSQEQFFEGGESICRNPTIQNMFMMLGPAEKAGSGGLKILEGWRKNNWKTPYVRERFRPDKVEIWLSMQSLLQPDIIQELSQRFNIDIQSIPSKEQTVLALALTEHYVTNERLRRVLGIHKSDITTLLQGLCRQGLLVSEGYGRGTKYHLAHKEVSSDAKGVSSDAKGVSSGVKGVSSEAKGVSSDSLSEHVQCLLRKQRVSKSELSQIFCEIAKEWISSVEMANITGRTEKYIRRVIPSLIDKGLLEMEYPAIPKHPGQRYRRIEKN